MSAKGRVSLRAPAGSAAHLSPMALRKSSFAQTTFHVRSETELSAAVNQITMALKDGQKPVVIGLPLFLVLSAESMQNKQTSGHRPVRNSRAALNRCALSLSSMLL